MRLIVISQRDRVGELEQLLATLEKDRNAIIIVCPSRRLLAKCDLRGTEIFEYLTNHQFNRIQLKNFSKELRLRFVRVIRNGSSLGLMTEKAIKFMISLTRGDLKTVSQQKSNTMLTTSNCNWTPPHHHELALTLENALNKAEVDLIEFFDVADLEIISTLGKESSIPISLR